MVRVAVVHSFYTERQPSGENSVVLDQVDQLSRAGHDVELIARSTDDYSARRSYSARSAATVITGRGPSPDAELVRFDPDVVHLHNTFPNWGTRWLRSWGSRTVVTMHNFRPLCSNGLQFRDGHACFDCLETPVIPAVRHRCYRRSAIASVPLALASSPRGALRSIPASAAKIITLNADAQRMYSSLFGDRVALIPNFVSPGRPAASSNGRWVYVGRLGAEKGIAELLSTWPTGEAIDIIGDGPLMASVRAAAKNHPGITAVGSLSRSSVLERLPHYEGMVLPSMCRESLPTAILEALANGLPLLLSHHVDAAEGLVDAGAAEVFRPGGGESGIGEKLASVRQRRDAMRSNALRVHERDFSPRVWQQAMNAIYEQMLRK